MTGPTRITGIDTHAHIFHPNAPMAEGRRYSPAYEAALADWFAHQDAHGLSHGVLIQPSFFGTDNSLIEAALTAFPDRLRGVAVIDPDIPDAELERLDSCGFVGARLNLVGRDIDDFGIALWQDFFGRLSKFRWQVEIQRSFDDLAEVVPVIAASGVTVMIDHFGLPQGGINPAIPAHRAFLDVLARTPSVWVKLSAPYRSAQTPEIAWQSFRLLREACGGTDRFVWGSDWPHTQHETATDYADQVARLHALVPDAAERDRILVANPAKLFRF
ncbi:amidohydrolase family protein [Falsirhodobacter sp. 20TX0035]|uniref:amidohydrolase family protein n=1 Tax=Falsirhodobacter sp. 20TX0035 TaxID=3022019 RepID=UPI00232B9B8E|nr:amidohydrolase family protein [Falsirhodobacter sp. 20TX0035]MDB6454179.1 amidohydrolase family protein [Falsirhodobacter sp. 20TX0035]